MVPPAHEHSQLRVSLGAREPLPCPRSSQSTLQYGTGTRGLYEPPALTEEQLTATDGCQGKEHWQVDHAPVGGSLPTHTWAAQTGFRGL